MSDSSAADDDSDSGDFKEEILRRLENDDPELTELFVKLVVGGAEVRTRNGYIITVEGVRDTEVLGKYLARCTHITKLNISIEEGLGADIVAPFLAGLQSNRSISELDLTDSRIPPDFFRTLTPFIASNPNLTKLDVYNCEMDADQYHSLALALNEGKSLKEHHIGGLVRGGQYDHEESIIDNIEALKMHPQLEALTFRRFSLGRNCCAALSGLLRQSSGLQKLALNKNDIDDTGIEALVEGLDNCRGLQELHLARNPSITARGWRAIASLLEDPNFRPQWINLLGNDIDDESATIIANALARNRSVVELNLDSNPNITSKGWDAFSKVLCDTSSVNSTFLSNHILQRLEIRGRTNLPYHIQSLLRMNELGDKKRVAFRKVLWHHDDFDMQPLFEWDLKALPFVVGWLTRAAGYEIECDASNRKRKLAAIYQFVRGMPELAIDGITGASKTSAKVGGKRPYSVVCE